MKPPKREFEKIEVDNWIPGQITEIIYDLKHQFKTSEKPAVKIKIALEGYKFPKSTPWLLFSYSKKSNLYLLFIESLVDGSHEDMEFDLDQLKGMDIRVMFEQKDEYQNIVRIRALKERIKPDPTFAVLETPDKPAYEQETPEEPVPF